MSFNFSNPYLIVLIGILIIENLSTYANNPQKLLLLVLSIPGILIAITFHEFAHAWMADKLGDDTPRRQGRLTLNPLAHIDPYGAILMLTAGFGWGKPVEISPYNFNRTISIKKGNALVSVAGPAMNFILAVIFSLIYGIALKLFGTFFYTYAGIIIGDVLTTTIAMNVGLGVFNLIPLYPLDGYKILLYFLPTNARNWCVKNQNVFYIVFIIIWLTPISSLLISPAINAIDNWLIKLIITIANL